MLKLALALLLFVPVGDEDSVFEALDKGDAKALKRYDTERLLKIIREGRPVHKAKAGETREDVTDAFGRTTDVVIRVPKSYNPSRPAGVLIALHGLGGNSSQLKDLYKKYAEKNGLILIAPSAQKTPGDAPNEDSLPKAISARMPHWWSYRDGNFALTALSIVKKRYAIDENQVILSGYSMGGFGTWNIGLRFPDRFAALVPFAGGVSRMEFVRKFDKKVRPIVRNAYTLPIFFIHGSADRTVPVRHSRTSRDQLKELGYDFVYHEVKRGRHILDVREGTPIMTKIQGWLEPKRRTAHPKSIDHFFIGEYCPQAYWVRVSEFSGKNASVKATIEGQTIDFSATGAASITFYVDETMLDLSKPILVTSGGKTLHRGVVQPSTDVILETWKAREDRDLLFRAKITVRPE